VAERAGVSRGAAQHHFPTREDLFMAAVEQVSVVRGQQIRDDMAGRHDVGSVIELVFGLYSGKLFRAALIMWVAAANEPELRAQIVPLEARIGREVHRLVVEALGVDERRPGVRESVQATLDLARGLGLANLLTNDATRRQGIAQQWALMLGDTLRGARA